MKVTRRALRNGSTTVSPPVKQRLSFDDVMDDDNKDAENVSGNVMLSIDEEIRKMLPCSTGDDGKPVTICLDFGTNPEQLQKNNIRICYGCELFLQEFAIAPPGRKKRMRPNKSMYKCSAKHLTLKEKEEPSKKKIKEMYDPLLDEGDFVGEDV